MGPIEVTTIILVSTFVAIIIGKYIYKKVKGIPSGGCSECHSLTGNKLVKQYHKAYCSCGCKTKGRRNN